MVPHAGSDRRRVGRIALQLRASARDCGRDDIPVRIVDISTHGCRIETLDHLFSGPPTLVIADFGAVPSRTVWQHGGLAGLEFLTPLSDTVIDRLLEAHSASTEATVRQLRELANRARLTSKDPTDKVTHGALRKMARDCAVQAIIAKMRLSETPHTHPTTPALTAAIIRRETAREIGPGFNFGFRVNWPGGH